MSNKPGSGPTDENQRLRVDCLELIHQSKVMTLGTAEPSGSPWCAPVYYYYEENVFYFFSNPESRHIRLGLDQSCSASIYKDAARFKELEGLQMSGTIRQISAGIRALKLAAAYCKHFGIQGTTGNLLAYVKGKFHADLYGFFPEDHYYMNNDKGLGTRSRIDI